MLTSVFALLLVQAPPTVVPAPPPIIVPTPLRTASVESAIPMAAETIAVRVTSPEGVLWQGTVRVSRNQGGDYNQSLTQAAGALCPPEYSYDRAARRNVTFSIYPQDNPQRGRSYRVSASWQRQLPQGECGETESRTVRVDSVVMLDSAGRAVIVGDAGLRVEISRQ